MASVPNLHDAAIAGINIDWEPSGVTATLTFSVVDGPPVRAVLTGVRLAHLERLDAWGPSEDVNEAQLVHREGVAELVLEMQSGDELLFEARDVVFVAAPTR